MHSGLLVEYVNLICIQIYGIIYVINATDQRRLDENKTLLLNMIKNENMQGKPILLLLNKQDQPGAVDEVDAAERLDLSDAVNRYKSPCRIVRNYSI